MKKILAPPSLILSFLLGSSICWGAAPKNVTLVIDHKLMQAYIEEAGQKKDVLSLSAGEKDIREIRNREEITIVLRHKNPVLYEYSWKGIIKEKTEDYQSALKLADMLKTVIKPISPEEIENGIIRATLEKDESLAASLGRLQSKLKEKKYEKLFANVRDLLGYSERIPALTRASIGEESDIRDAKSEVQNWDIDNRAKEVSELYAEIDKFQIDYIRKQPGSRIGRDISAGAQNDGQIDIQLMLFAKDQQATIMKILESLKAFATAFQGIDNPVDLRLDKVTYSGTERASGSLVVTSAIPEPEDPLIKQALARHTGTFNFLIEPYTPVRFTLKPTLVYSFARNADGKPVGWLTPLVFGIIPRFLDDPVFGAELQLGIVMGNEKQGFFLGGGIKIYTNIFLGGGATYQQVGTDIYVWGGYLNIAYDLK